MVAIKGIATCRTLANLDFDGNITTNFERHCMAASQEKDRMFTIDTMMLLGRLALIGVALVSLTWMAVKRGSLRPAAIRQSSRRGLR
ncbi:hypothetical protein QU481_20950 [Crenobacter sp. SG2303]|uniref:Uncharacterized protein n=1 Tax=Crenobacter oryzisoli TaxID=3056844 RepID=A0ABT7XU92_9NEIS|nr:hypothetical protein [Crenobacter sp. SG2303]MDN0077305.1 hypothetical protein [Crenobacter sp. SG2303]